ncbi:Uncharacterised protein [Mycobacterium tuberculosis]|nr:Uncharacterised protein [Mycobacterium tuberculosis]COW32228.1 Uncharacterised protein [Mycobacterium tuberculosis]COW82208.1 Uncharacterised protein [Mycobacterium tuberculosis]SGO42010.1 Uncharacterised protein [Mycobacterium tuberculosis]
MSIEASTCSQRACWFLDNVRPMTLTSNRSTARLMVVPQPHPMSSSVMPGLRSSLSRLRSTLAYWASSSVSSGGSK